MVRINGQKLLATYAGVLSLGVTAALLSGFTTQGNARFDTITVQRINVVGGRQAAHGDDEQPAFRASS